MRKAPQHKAEEKGKIQAFSDQKLSIRTIAHKLSYSRAVVHSYVRAPTGYGTLKQPCWPRTLSETAKSHLFRLASAGDSSSPKLQKELFLPNNSHLFWLISSGSGGFEYKRMKSCPLMTRGHKESRITLEEKHHARRFLQWSRVLISEEKTFRLEGPDVKKSC